MTLRWQSAGQRVRPAPVGQAGSDTLFIITLVCIFYCMGNHTLPPQKNPYNILPFKQKEKMQPSFVVV